MAELNVYKRTDNKFGWRLKADNGQIVATDGSQGYSNRSDAEAMGTKVVQGGYKDAKVTSGCRHTPSAVMRQPDLKGCVRGRLPVARPASAPVLFRPGA